MTIKVGEWDAYNPVQLERSYHVDLLPLSKGERLVVAVIKADGTTVELKSVPADEDTKVHLMLSYKPYLPEQI